MTTCKNCGNDFEGNYCNQCGQSAATQRINFKFFWHDIQLGLFYFDKGIFYSLWQLCIRPGHAINEYLSGKRVRHFKPLSLVLVLATVYGLLKYFFLIEVPNSANLMINGAKINVETIRTVNEWISSHGAIMALVVIPFYALASFLAFRKQGYNYMEHLVLNAYASSFRLLVTLIMFPLVLLTQHHSGGDTINNITYILEFAVTCWCFLQFFNQLKWYNAFKKLIYTFLIFITEILVIAVILIVILALFVFPVK